MGWTYKSRAVPNRGNATGGKDKMAKAATDRLATAQAAFEKQSQRITERLKEAIEKGNQEQIAELKRRKKTLEVQFANLKKRSARIAGVETAKEKSTSKEKIADATNPEATNTVENSNGKTSTGAMTAEQACTIGEQALSNVESHAQCTRNAGGCNLFVRRT